MKRGGEERSYESDFGLNTDEENRMQGDGSDASDGGDSMEE